jgi:hypothetical protein
MIALPNVTMNHLGLARLVPPCGSAFSFHNFHFSTFDLPNVLVWSHNEERHSM